MPEIEFKEGIRRGLRPSPNNPRNTEAFVELYGTKASPWGFIPHVSLTNPVTSVSVAPPHPQFFRTSLGTFLLTDDRVYTVNETTFALTLQTCKNAYDTLYNYGIDDAGGQWHCIDLDGMVMFLNETNVLLYAGGVLLGQNRWLASTGCEHRGRVLFAGFSDEAGRFWNAEWQAVQGLLDTKSTTIDLMSTTTWSRWIWWSALLGGNILWWLYPVMAIYGSEGVGPDLVACRTFAYGSTGWTLVSAARDPIEQAVYMCQTPGESYIQQTLTVTSATYVVGYEVRDYASGEAYCKFGDTEGTRRTADGYYYEEFTASGTSVNLRVHAEPGSTLAITNVTCRRVLRPDGFGLSKPFILDFEMRNDSGAGVIEWPGTVLALRPLRDHVIAYCEDGVLSLTPEKDPTPTLGVKQILDVGPLDRGACGGTLTEHVMVDKTGRIRRIDNALNVSLLDRHEFLEGLSDCSVSFNPIDDEWYICGKQGGVRRAWCIMGSAVSELPYYVTSVLNIQGDLVATYEDISGRTFRAVTDTFDCGTRALKTIVELEFGISTGSQQVYAQLDYKLDPSDTEFQPGAPNLIRDKGRVQMLTTGTEFRLVMFSPSATFTGEMDYVRAHWRPASKISVADLLGG